MTKDEVADGIARANDKKTREARSKR